MSLYRKGTPSNCLTIGSRSLPPITYVLCGITLITYIHHIGFVLFRIICIVTDGVLCNYVPTLNHNVIEEAVNAVLPYISV
jgi:hypothetical protein